ncbi:hypothetical protein PR048_002330 [Dryococelus australis]|uniref:Uncharacterized protein n=1 Tax=Dryococelus australis TaxID=614101 RepID=A0ABQ9IJZ7_9NEOP|nr:hypothetical protein PR048_002330 [Dryococelus australis]
MSAGPCLVYVGRRSRVGAAPGTGWRDAARPPPPAPDGAAGGQRSRGGGRARRVDRAHRRPRRPRGGGATAARRAGAVGARARRRGGLRLQALPPRLPRGGGVARSPACRLLPGEAADTRGVVRLVRRCYECKACAGERTASALDFRRHCESETHQARLRAAASSMPPPPPAASPSAGLSHEMEDVVNQITMLAAQNNTDSNANIKERGGDFCAAAKMAPPLALSTAGP